MKKYYFVGIGGSGMNPLAQVLRQQGHSVSGSDRSFDRGTSRELFAKLRALGISLFPQDGSGITGDLDCLVVSTAIEAQNRELERAREFSIPAMHRADLLAELFNAGFGIAIAGTSGKTTVTAMAASVLDAASRRAAFTAAGAGVFPSSRAAAASFLAAAKRARARSAIRS